MPVDVHPLIAVWSPFPAETDDSRLVDGQELLDPVMGAGAAYPVAWREAVFSMARRSDTWDTAAHADH